MTLYLRHRDFILRFDSSYYQSQHRTESLLRHVQISNSSAHAMLQSIQNSFHCLENFQTGAISTPRTASFTSSQSSSKSSRLSASHPCGDSIAIRDSSVNQLRFDTTFTRSCCSFCSCSCHRQIRLKSPNFLKNILGLIFVGYTSVPLASAPQACNLLSCRRQGESTIVATYVFPFWFFQRTIFMKFKARGPELLLRVRRVRPNDAAIFLALENNNIKVVKKLLAAGEASILDVNEDGQSLLHVCYYLFPIRCLDY